MNQLLVSMPNNACMHACAHVLGWFALPMHAACPGRRMLVICTGSGQKLFCSESVPRLLLRVPVTFPGFTGHKNTRETCNNHIQPCLAMPHKKTLQPQKCRHVLLRNLSTRIDLQAQPQSWCQTLSDDWPLQFVAAGHNTAGHYNLLSLSKIVESERYFGRPYGCHYELGLRSVKRSYCRPDAM